MIRRVQVWWRVAKAALAAKRKAAAGVAALARELDYAWHMAEAHGAAVRSAVFEASELQRRVKELEGWIEIHKAAAMMDRANNPDVAAAERKALARMRRLRKVQLAARRLAARLAVLSCGVLVDFETDHRITCTPELRRAVDLLVGEAERSGTPAQGVFYSPHIAVWNGGDE